mmetsp:Transcript_34158/g.59675  ORF Transcript_34158/g.59675 Transcript_34158/m.59675 type:complete len:471 (-) Transcript_34158:23-1435(-)|eukprot:CAMPEP_0204905506 /NCGR_PEP_ID=MMETSP1397-20131031/5455_1 /ASSEMBLY_ACC=CAM_ASM_000891 /TAXON_ID=49980 /ORGANISM="Climacostomum Climacostomum virens, Strain Stock W-24" /LENGTH=470 /DNA_ID=CAMNT_0052074391 /DNA_START=16 /DNA_END=1428 /DNA_ORIENTATION=-
MAYQELAKSYYPKKIWGCAFTIGLSSFYWGYYLGVLGTPIDNIAKTEHWGSNKGLFTALFSALFPFGATFGAVYGGTKTKTVGRRKILIQAGIFGIISSIINAIPFTPAFAIGRFCCGLAGGVMAAVPSIFITEISPTELSGKTGILVQFMVTFAILLSYLLGIPLPVGGSSDPFNEWWIFMILFPVFAIGLQLLLFICIYKHEPAAWLLTQGRTEEASASAKFFLTEEIAHAYIVKLTSEAPKGKDIDLDSVKEVSDDDGVTFKELLSFSGKYKKMMVLGCCLQLIQQWCGINAVINYSTVIFQGISGQFMARVFGSIVMLVNMVATLGGVPFVDRAGRRPLFIVGCAGMMVTHIILGLLDVLAAPPMVAVFLICIFIIFFEISLGPVTWLYCGEIMIDKGIAIAVAINWMSATIVTLTFPYIIMPGMYVAFFLYGSVCAAGLAFCLIFVKETKGLSKEEIKSMIFGAK